MPATVTRRQHTPADLAHARRLQEGGWTYAEIQRLLADDGVEVHQNTIRIWCSEQAREVHNRADTRKKARDRAARSGGRLRSNASSIEFRTTRLIALHRAGLSPRAIAIVLNFDLLGNGITEREVRHAIDGGRAPRRWRLEQTT